jgi:hypothetical protein
MDSRQQPSFFKPFALLLAIVCILPGCAGPAKKSDLVSSGGAVVVWNLEDLSPLPAPVADLGELLSGAVIDVIQSESSYTVVEREKLLLALEELYLGTSEIADEQTQLRLGRIVGARWMIFGGYQTVGDMMRLDMRRVEVSTGRVVATVKKEVSTPDVGQWIQSAREAARELL